MSQKPVEYVPMERTPNPKALIFGFGNVLLDKVVTVGAAFLRRYDLEPNTTTLLTPADEEDKRREIFTELEKPDYLVTHCVGGCAANSLRVAQWILQKEGSTAFVGAVGSDEDSIRLGTLMTLEGILMRAQKVENAATGKCAVLINADDATRTLVTQLGASVKFCHKDWVKEEWDFFQTNCGLIFISGYFLAVSHLTVKTAVEFGCRKGVPVVLALNAVWVVTKFFQEIVDLLPYVDYVIGNSEEMRVFGNLLELQTDNLSTVTNHLHQIPKNGTLRRTVICTDGESPVVVSFDGTVEQFPVIETKPEDIKDTNGAGDAFTGGLLASILQARPLSECIACGLWAALQVIQHTGCNFPKEKTFTFND